MKHSGTEEDRSDGQPGLALAFRSSRSRRTGIFDAGICTPSAVFDHSCRHSLSLRGVWAKVECLVWEIGRKLFRKHKQYPICEILARPSMLQVHLREVDWYEGAVKFVTWNSLRSGYDIVARATILNKQPEMVCDGAKPTEQRLMGDDLWCVKFPPNLPYDIVNVPMVVFCAEGCHRPFVEGAVDKNLDDFVLDRARHGQALCVLGAGCQVARFFHLHSGKPSLPRNLPSHPDDSDDRSYKRLPSLKPTAKPSVERAKNAERLQDNQNNDDRQRYGDNALFPFHAGKLRRGLTIGKRRAA